LPPLNAISASGLTAGGGAYFTRLNMPVGKVREIIFTGRRFYAHELRDTGLCDYILPRDQVLGKSLEIAEVIAGKSFAALQAVKRCANAVLDLSFADAMKLTQEQTAHLTAGPDSKEGIKAFLEKRDPTYADGSGKPAFKTVSAS
jgi:enoyl-CoA hydratase/carnithine racemase